MRSCLALALLLVLPSAYGADNNDKEFDEITKEITDFHGQAEQMLKQLEKATNSVQPGGEPNAVEEARKKAMKLASDDRFLKSAGDLWRHPDRNKLLAIQAGFFLLMLIVKAWRQSKARHWFKKLLVGFLLSVLTWVGLLYVLPLLVLGEPFGVFTGTLWRVFVMGG